MILTDLNSSIAIEDVRRGTRLSEYQNRAKDGQRALAVRGSSSALRRFLLSGGRKLALFDVDEENLRILLDESAAPGIGDLALSKDWTLLACEVGREVWIWDCDSGQLLCQTRMVDEGVTDLAFSPDDQRLVAGSLDGLLRMWDVATGQAADWRISSQHTDGINAVAFSPDGALLASAGQDRTIRLQSSKSGSPVGVLVGHEGEIKHLVFSPDGSRLASASADGTIRIWEVDAAKDPRVLRGHTFIVYPVAISPDGTRIASGDWNGVIRLWDAASSKQITAIEPRAVHRTLVYDAAFSPDGAFLAVSEETWDTPRGVDAEYWIRILDAITGETLAQLGLGSRRWLTAR